MNIQSIKVIFLVCFVASVSTLLTWKFSSKNKECERERVPNDFSQQITQKPSTLPPPVVSVKIQKNIVSYGLYGDKPKYMIGALRNAELVKYILPGWNCRFYHDSTVPKHILHSLTNLGAELIDVSSGGMQGGIGGMFWRFLIAGDETVDRFIIRDVDSRLNPREAAAIKEWIESGVAFHSMRDHPNHNYPFNGGMWGAVKGAIPDIVGKIKAWRNKDKYLEDMNFLQSVIWPIARDKIISHDSYHCKNYPNSKPFPTQRLMKEHVGQVFDHLESPRLGDIQGFLDRETPVECRKIKEWLFG